MAHCASLQVFAARACGRLMKLSNFQDNHLEHHLKRFRSTVTGAVAITTLLLKALDQIFIFSKEMAFFLT